MEKYLGLKLVSAESQTLDQSAGAENKGDLSKLHGGIDQDGYKVVYEDGYTSWSPKDVFEKAYRKINNLTFGLAIEALKQGKLVTRKGWNGKGMFIMKQIPAEIGLDIIPKMQSVQQTAKDKLIDRGTSLKYQNQMLIIKEEGTADSWVASSSDIFAEDWAIVE